LAHPAGSCVSVARDGARGSAPKKKKETTMKIKSNLKAGGGNVGDLG
jgi:hypothetical protein